MNVLSILAMGLALLAISGCSENKQQIMAQCKLEAMRHNMAGDDRNSLEFVRTCMEANGYYYDVRKPIETCSQHYPERDYRCFEPTTFLGKIKQAIQF